MDKILTALAECNIKEYLITKESVRSCEHFYIRHSLDLVRSTDVVSYTVTVYTQSTENGNSYRHSATVVINPTQEPEEIRNVLNKALYSAGFVKNRYYDFVEGEKCNIDMDKDAWTDMSLSDTCKEMARQAFEADTNESAFLNNMEIFVEEKKVRKVSSYGTDVSFARREIKGEFVIQCKEPADVETYKDFKYNKDNYKDFGRLIRETMVITADRANAVTMPPSGTMDVILSGQYVSDLIGFYKSRGNAANVYVGYSDYKIGETVQKDAEGDVLNLKLVPDVPFDGEGIILKELDFIKDGRLESYHGGQRFSYYLNVPVKGYYDKIKMNPGTEDLSDISNRKCLKIVNFSDFQMDDLSGTYGGEIRLGYLSDGKGNVSLVTGGSVNGSIFEASKKFVLSKDIQRLPDFEGPKEILLVNASIAGLE